MDWNRFFFFLFFFSIIVVLGILGSLSCGGVGFFCSSSSFLLALYECVQVVCVASSVPALNGYIALCVEMSDIVFTRCDCELDA